MNQRLSVINHDLGDNNDLFEPKIDENLEYPEKFFEVQDQDIETFRKLKIERELKANQAKKGGRKGAAQA